MKKINILLIGLILSISIFSSCSQESEASLPELSLELEDHDDRVDKGRLLINQKKWDEAITYFKKLTKDAPHEELAWFYLAYAHHNKKEYKKAIEIYQKSEKFQLVKSNSLYNMACAYALLGEQNHAVSSLSKAMEAGFLDYDLLKNDPDLASLRKANLIELPKKQKYETLKAHNGVVVKYQLILPENYKASESYPALVAYPPGSQEETSADWALTKFWGEGAAKKGWIIIVPVAPKNGWMNHPSHHALNDLLDHVKKDYKIDGKFHMAGFGQGARPAASFAIMSKEYFQSLTVVSAYHFNRWDDGDFRSFKNMKVKLIVGEQDTYGVKLAQETTKHLEKFDAKVSLEIIPNEGYSVPSIRNGTLIDRMEGFVN